MIAIMKYMNNIIGITALHYDGIYLKYSYPGYTHGIDFNYHGLNQEHIKMLYNHILISIQANPYPVFIDVDAWITEII